MPAQYSEDVTLDPVWAALTKQDRSKWLESSDIEYLPIDLAEIAKVAENAGQPKMLSRGNLLDPVSGGELFRKLGGSLPEHFDAITHTGGRIMGNREHPVWIALDPSQIYAPYVAPALQQVPELAQVPEMMQSPRMAPLLAALLGQNALQMGGGY